MEKSDGIVVSVNGKEEGSDSRDIAYKCNEKGEYDMPTRQGKWKFPKCIPRRKQTFQNTEYELDLGVRLG